MGSEFLADYIDNATLELETYVPAAVRGELDFKNLLQLCFRFRQRGVCSFLLDGNPGPLLSNFMQSTGAYMAYLPGIDDAQKVTSHSKPFYDAVGAGFWDPAAFIARASRKTWNQSKEYEDDFLFVFFLMKRFFLGGSDAECRALIDAHARAAEGKDQPHRDICLGLLEKDAARFDAGLRQTLDERAERVEALIDREAMPEESWSWLRYFSSEGLAVVRLADWIGLPIDADYRHVNELVRRAPTPSFDPNAWQRIV